jgi:uncharacterized membrane protein YedE/YeeE
LKRHRSLRRLRLIVKYHESQHQLLEKAIRTFLLLLASLSGSLVFGTAVAYVALETLPCHWFGTGFEGACAYGALWASIGTGLERFPIVFDTGNK